jgi:hypothetical protein
MTETPKDLNKTIFFRDYCWTWKLKVNIDKTKIIYFTNGRLPQIYNLHKATANLKL